MRRKNSPGCPCCGGTTPQDWCFGDCSACDSGRLPSILYVRDANGTWKCGLGGPAHWRGYGYGRVDRRNNDASPSCGEATAGNIIYRYDIQCITIEEQSYLRVTRQWGVLLDQNTFVPCSPTVYRDVESPTAAYTIGSSAYLIDEIGDCSDFEIDGTLAADIPSRPDPFGGSFTIYPERDFPEKPYCCGRLVVAGCGGRRLDPLYSAVQVRVYDREGGTLLASGTTDIMAGVYLMWPHRASYWVEVDSPSERFRPIRQTVTLENALGTSWPVQCGSAFSPLATVLFQAADGYVCAPNFFVGCAYPIKKTLHVHTPRGDVTLTWREDIPSEGPGWWGSLEVDAPVLTGYTYTVVGPICFCSGCVIENRQINTWFEFASAGQVSNLLRYFYGRVVLSPCNHLEKYVRLSGDLPSGLTPDCPIPDPGCDCGTVCAVFNNGTNGPLLVVCPKPDEGIAFFVQGTFGASSRPIGGDYTITE